MIEVKVPDIGDFSDVPVIEILVSPGEVVQAEDPLVALESDKATMEVPAPSAGRVVEVLVAIGETVSEGSPILKLEPEVATGSTSTSSLGDEENVQDPKPEPQEEIQIEAERSGAVATANEEVSTPRQAGPVAAKVADVPGAILASPSVRRLARELDLDLASIAGTGPKGRVTKDDVKRAHLASAPLGTAGGIPQVPPQDFEKFGPIETRPLSRLKRLSGPHLYRAWLNVPHVTHTDEADITELEAFRKQLDIEARPEGYRVTLLSFLMMASAATLMSFPEVNASLSPEEDALILKRYYNIGVAVDTNDGLVVPVIKNVDRKGIVELSRELSEISQRMRDGTVAPSDIQGATFSISSLGGIGGTNFTPIVNAPQAAILGVVRASMRPVWTGDAFVPRMMLPLCLSYDHRIIDGADAARFTRRLAEILGDVRQLIL